MRWIADVGGVGVERSSARAAAATGIEVWIGAAPVVAFTHVARVVAFEDGEETCEIDVGREVDEAGPRPWLPRGVKRKPGVKETSLPHRGSPIGVPSSMWWGHLRSRRTPALTSAP